MALVFFFFFYLNDCEFKLNNFSVLHKQIWHIMGMKLNDYLHYRGCLWSFLNTFGTRDEWVLMSGWNNLVSAETRTLLCLRGYVGDKIHILTDFIPLLYIQVLPLAKYVRVCESANLYTRIHQVPFSYLFMTCLFKWFKSLKKTQTPHFTTELYIAEWNRKMFWAWVDLRWTSFQSSNQKKDKKPRDNPAALHVSWH